MTNTEGGTDNEEFRVAAVMDRVNTTWEAWLGSSFSCAQCHNHPYDPFTQKNYYQFYAFFNNTRDQDLGTEMPTYKFFDTINQQKIDALLEWLDKTIEGPQVAKENQKSYYQKLIHLTEPKLTVNDCVEQENAAINPDMIMHYHGGYTWFKEVPLNKADKILVNFSHTTPGTITVHLDQLDGPIISRWEMKKSKKGLQVYDIQPIAGNHNLYFRFNYQNKAYRVASSGIRWWVPFRDLPGKSHSGYKNASENLNTILETNPKSKVPLLQEAQHPFSRQTHVFERGNWLVHGEAVSPRVPNSVSPEIKADTLNRLYLAEWMISDKHPLTARVFVNRVWEQLFGRGLVLTTEDLGTQGEAPSHPELLDWLAYRFIHKHKWRLKPLLKEIMSSATYQQSSTTNPDWIAQDPENIWLARGPKFRLSAEQVHDHALQVAGLLSPKMYGPSVMPPQPEGIWQVVYSSERWKVSEGEDRYRRALYTYWRRTSPYPSMISFDSPSREFCVSRRIRTNTPLQALVTLNDPVYIEAGQVLAHKILELTNEQSFDQAIDQVYQSMLFEPIPTNDLKVIKQLYQETLTAYQANVPDAKLIVEEFQALHPEKIISESNIPAFAAMTAVTNVLLNLDAVLTKS